MKGGMIIMAKRIEQFFICQKQAEYSVHKMIGGHLVCIECNPEISRAILKAEKTSPFVKVNKIIDMAVKEIAVNPDKEAIERIRKQQAELVRMFAN